MHSIYTKLSSHPLTVRKREREVTAHMQETVFTLEKLKIVPTIRNVHHIQCQCIYELSSLVGIKLQHPFPESN